VGSHAAADRGQVVKRSQPGLRRLEERHHKTIAVAIWGTVAALLGIGMAQSVHDSQLTMRRRCDAFAETAKSVATLRDAGVDESLVIINLNLHLPNADASTIEAVDRMVKKIYRYPFSPPSEALAAAEDACR
jgi:hypothetical protein